MEKENFVLSEEYKKQRRIKAGYLLAFTVIIFLLALLACFMGVTNVTPIRLFNTVFHQNFRNAEPLTKLECSVLINIRLCRIVMAVITGAGLALCGVIMQSITGNSMASPFTTGVSSAAGFGAAVGIVFFGNQSNTVILLAFLFSALCTIAVYGISFLKDFKANTLILMGVAINYLFSALNSCLQYFANEHQLESIVYWTFGSLTDVVWSQVAVTAVVLATSFLYFMLHAKDYNVLASSGDESAKSLGINVKLLRGISGITVALLAAVLVSFTGVIGFVRLVAPHIAKFIVGGEHRVLLPMSAFIGAALVLVGDTIGRTIINPVIIPVGVVVSLIGVPVFIYLIMRERRG
ncbi:MAG: iron ABC transporter permease [Candidatus Limivivens sp.]|nr:iron ABC transporter permease [Candidatus Limivivens sp.]